MTDAQTAPADAPAYIVPGVVHPDRLPGEPDRAASTGPLAMAVAALRLVLIMAIGLALSPLWLLVLLGAAVWGLPPNMVRPAQALYYLGLVWHRAPPEPGMSRLLEVRLSAAILRTLARAPLLGLAWMLDELLYGRALTAVEVRAPIIKISAARSGSTQLAHYIEQDPRVVSPGALQILAPYLWLWRLAAATVGRLVDKDTVRGWFERWMPLEFTERHELDAFGPDTFEIGLLTMHLNRFAPFLGPQVLVEELGQGAPGPTTDRLMTETFVALLDRTLRKTLLFAGNRPEQRVFVKGHFLAAADALAARYPDGRFLTMTRQPSKRLRSMINFLWSNPMEPALGKPAWRFLVEGLAETERLYNQREMQWFGQAGQTDGPRRLALPFDAYVRDLESTMRAVYAHCFDEETLPDGVPTAHAPRERKNYSVDRSFAQLGLDGAAYDAAQPEYTAWCRGAAPRDQSTDATSANPSPNSVAQASAAR